ncbi:MAG: hypothetical protein H7Y33_05960 [Cytophagales bacterium]|nr:hypothetical protein [Rhizobacter sp.]
MSWIGLVVAAICAALAGVITTVALRHRTEEKLHYVGMWVVVAGVLFGGANHVITPALQVRYDVSRIDASLSSNAAFSAIKKHDPLTYGRITAELRDGLLSGRSKADLIEMLRNEVSTLVQQRLPRASDEAATEYMRVMVQEMGELRRHGGELCYRFLFAQPGQGVDLTRYVSANTMEADSAALSQVVRSSTVSPQPVPVKSEVESRLQPVVALLAARYGPDLALLQQPRAPGIDRDKLCAINIDMYTVILQLPMADSGKLIRYLMGGQS